MMKILIMLSLIILSLFTTSVFFILVYAMSMKKRKRIKRFRGDLIHTQTLELESDDYIVIEGFTEDIYLKPTDSKECSFNEYRSRKAVSKELAVLSRDGNEIRIQGNGSKFPNSKKYYQRLELCIPKEFIGGIDVSTTSGHICQEGELNLLYLKLTGESGDVFLDQVTAKSIEVTTTSGMIIVQRAEGQRMFRSTSGYIKINAGTGDSILHSKSGGITLMNANGYIEVITKMGAVLVGANEAGGNVSTDTGRIDFSILTCSESITLSSQSADIVLQVGDQMNCYLTAQTESGRIKSFTREQPDHASKPERLFAEIGENRNITCAINTINGDIIIKN